MLGASQARGGCTVECTSMIYADARRRLHEIFVQKLQGARAQGRETVELQRTEITKALPELEEERAVDLAISALENEWRVVPRGRVWTRNDTYFQGAWFTDEEGYHRLYDDYKRPRFPRASPHGIMGVLRTCLVNTRVELGGAKSASATCRTAPSRLFYKAPFSVFEAFLPKRAIRERSSAYPRTPKRVNPQLYQTGS